MWKRKRGTVVEVYLCHNGNVVAFDKDDNQVVKCQGFFLDRAKRLRKYTNENTVWYFGKRNSGMTLMNISWWWKAGRHHGWFNKQLRRLMKKFAIGWGQWIFFP